MSLPFTPVIIIGAARSGTNMLRDMLSALPGFATWPCDEINPIWRHRNRGWPDDEIPARLAARGRGYIRRRFVRLWRRTGRPPFVVEKTCANSLRVPFVREVLPEARFIQIVRDGADVIASAQRRWRGELELSGIRYFAAKARFAPVADLPSIGLEFVANRMPLAFGRGKRLRVWGPKFAGQEAVIDRPLSEICALQWAACMARSDAAFADMPEDTWLRLHYEDIVASPEAALRAMTGFLKSSRMDPLAIAASVAIVSPGGSRKNRQTEPSGPTQRIFQAMRRKHGYEG